MTEEPERFDEYDDEPRPAPPRREAFVLFYAIVALTLVHEHGAIRGLREPWPRFSWFFINFLVLFCVPALFIRYVWRRPLAEYGLQWGRWRTWVPVCLALFAIMLPVVLISSRSQAFHTFYPLVAQARASSGWLLLSALGWLVYFFAWEWFFRGFMLSALAPRYGGGIAILMQTLPFVMMHFGKPTAEVWGAVITGLVLGLLAFRTNSFLGPWLLHWAVALSMDLAVVWWPLK